MEVETLVRYRLMRGRDCFNNGGVYGGDRRNLEEIIGPYKDDPAPTSFVPVQRYHHLVMEAFGGKGYLVGTPKSSSLHLTENHFRDGKQIVINVTIDPYAGARKWENATQEPETIFPMLIGGGIEHIML
ncbi:hypothetical protein IFM89_028190 [Coptis chinensis]|uniref:Uncharacterized protein n=1 Tax=Coptis chinensis TaxID=261450 RepID=A0A835HI38_9MAGN|nr:hypothetical protein IFM89_028190 [Coptis chinensis]